MGAGVYLHHVTDEQVCLSKQVKEKLLNHLFSAFNPVLWVLAIQFSLVFKVLGIEVLPLTSSSQSNWKGNMFD